MRRLAIALALVALLTAPRPARAQGEGREARDSGEARESGDAGGDRHGEAPDEAAGGGGPGSARDADRGEGGAVLQRPPADGVPDPRSRVAVLVLAATGVDPDTADALTELAIGAVAARGGVTIVGKEELQARLGHAEARSIECVTSTTCLGRVGVELGVDEVVAGTVGRRGDRWVFDLNRIDIRTGRLAGRVFREVAGDLGNLADALQDAVPALYVVARRPATLLVSSNVAGSEVTVDGVLAGVYRDAPVRLDDVPAGRHEIVVGASGHFDFRRTLTIAEGATLQIDAALEVAGTTPGLSISPLVWIGGGLAVAGAATAIYFGLSSGAEADLATRRDALDYVDARRTDAAIANGGFAAVGAGLATLLLGLLLSGAEDDEEAERPVATVSPVPGGLWVAVRAGGP